MRLVRLPFRIERIQPEIGGGFEPAEAAELDRCVKEATDAGLLLVLDAHNYAQRGAQPIQGADLAEFWSMMGERYRPNRRVAFGLMNEPYVYSSKTWHKIAIESLKAIRAAGCRQLVIIPSSGWSGAHNLASTDDKTLLAEIDDENHWIEVHQYLDHDFSGRNPHEYSIGIGATVLRNVTGWARARRKSLFLGEFGFALPSGANEAKALLRYMHQNADVWVGYAIWAAGPWWGDYPFSVEPKDGKESAQMMLLREFLP